MTIFAQLRELLSLVWNEASRFVRVRLVAVLLLVLGTSILSALGPVALKLLVDAFTGHGRAGSIYIALLVGLYILSQWVSRSIGEIRGFVYARAERRMLRTLAERLYAHLLSLPLKYHLERQTGAVTQTLENGLQGFQLALHHLAFTFLPVLGELGTIVLVLIRLAHPEFLALFCCAVACYAVMFAYSAATISKVAKRASTARVEASASMVDGVVNYEAVKFFAAESIVQERVSRALSRSETQWIAFYRRYAVNGLCVATICAAFLAVAIVYAAQEVFASRLTIGDFVLVNTYMLQVVRPVETLGLGVQGLSQSVAMLEKMLALLKETPEPQSAGDDAALDGPGELEFQNVVLSYRADRTVLKGVSFKVPAGRTLGIVGTSGSGKSTIVRLLVRLLEPDSGRVLIDGTPISALSLASLRRSIAVVPQDTVLFNDTIACNIGFGKAGSSREEIEEAARLAHLHEFVMGLPDRYETQVGERGVKLSGGEKQRVSIARAALKRPLIYVFDEATSSLDSRTEREILQNLQELSRFSTTLIIAHRLSTVVHADEIIVVEAGAILEQGTHESLLRHGGKYAALWAAQQREPSVVALERVAS